MKSCWLSTPPRDTLGLVKQPLGTKNKSLTLNHPCDLVRRPCPRSPTSASSDVELKVFSRCNYSILTVRYCSPVLRWTCVYPCILTSTAGLSVGFQVSSYIWSCKVAKGQEAEKTQYVPLHRRIPPPLRWYRLKNLTTLKNVYGPVERGNSLLVQHQK